jgi:toxin ParE1/3/4
MVKIVWTDRADEDMAQISAFWFGISEYSEQIQIDRIFNKIQLIEDFPKSGRIVPELGHPQIREHISGNYRIVYYIVSKIRIDILTVHSSARPLDMINF